MRHEVLPGGAPSSATSPPPLHIAASHPDSARTAIACSSAHPFASPVGSTPPGIAQGSNQPSESATAPRQSVSTSVISGGAASSGRTPARTRLIGLSGIQRLRTASSSWSRLHARAIASRDRAPSALVTSKETTVPITSS